MAKCVHGACNGSGFPGAKCDTCASVWCKNGNHNFKQSFTIAPGTTGMNRGGNQWKFHWN